MSRRSLVSGSALVAFAFHGAAAASDSVVEYIRVESEALDRAVPAGVYLPPSYDDSDERYPVLYFLHGMFGDERKWENRGCAEILDELIDEGEVPPMIVVAPSGERSCFWVNWKSGGNDWEDFVARDLVAEVDRRFRTLADREHRGISGDSMGGYGALHIAFKHPDVFGSASAHSAMLYPVELDRLPTWILERADSWAPIYGSPVDEDHWRRNHPLFLARTLDVKTLCRLRIYFDCGSEDRFGFDQGARELDRILEERGVPHEAFIREGNHGRGYFLRYVPYSLKFHGEVFRVGDVRSDAPDARHRDGEDGV